MVDLAPSPTFTALRPSGRPTIRNPLKLVPGIVAALVVLAGIYSVQVVFARFADQPLNLAWRVALIILICAVFIIGTSLVMRRLMTYALETQFGDTQVSISQLPVSRGEPFSLALVVPIQEPYRALWVRAKVYLRQVTHEVPSESSKRSTTTTVVYTYLMNQASQAVQDSHIGHTLRETVDLSIPTGDPQQVALEKTTASGTIRAKGGESWWVDVRVGLKGGLTCSWHYDLQVR
ncbi:MAG: hypothetical protein GYB68_17055 [Chloroflexi bacterium]|nr:hypothetical protein [Chloroflexota bacterium]